MSTDQPTIIHFTRTVEQLEGILSIGFKIKFCRECIRFGEVEKRFRIPMVSFCDIPIVQANAHMDKYGFYAIGLTEDWAAEKGLSPVTYLPENADRTKSKLATLNRAVEQDQEVTLEPLFTAGGISLATILDFARNDVCDGKPLMDALDDLRYLKNYKGPLVRANGDTIKTYYFKDESEWRYLPKTQHFHKFILPEEAFKLVGMAETLQRFIEDERLMFSASDVQYLLIEKEEDRSELESHIRSLDRFTREDMESLISKICTVQQTVKS